MKTVLVSLAIPFVLLAGSAARAETFYVRTADDGAEFSLRDLIIKANATPEEDVISLWVGDYYVSIPGRDEDGALTGDLDIAPPGITITGYSNDKTVLVGSRVDAMFHVLPGASLALLDLAVTGGAGTGGAGGGFTVDGVLSLERCAVDNNRAERGAGVRLTNPAAALKMRDCTFWGNEAALGAAIDVEEGFAGMINSTISSNGTGSAALRVTGDGSMSIRNCTITQNGNGVRLEGPNASLDVVSSIIDGNVGDDVVLDSQGVAVSFGYNLVGTGDTGIFDADGDLVGVDARLEPLWDNDGPSYTHRPSWDSPAVDAGYNAYELDTDQRGMPRVFGDGPDIGACEREFNRVVTTTADGGPGSLRQAILDANLSEGQDRIEVLPGHYTLTLQGRDEDACASGDLDIGPGDLEIWGTSGADVTIVDAASIDGVFDVLPGANVELRGLTITGGQGGDSPSLRGGGVSVQGVAGLRKCVITGNTAPFGGGVLVDGQEARLEAQNTAFTGNSGPGSAVAASLGQVRLFGCTVHGNLGGEGCVRIEGNASGLLQNDTITSNEGGLVLAGSSSWMSVKSSIVWDNVTDLDAEDPTTFESQGKNLVGNPGALSSALLETDLLGQDPHLAPMRLNGGHVPTRKPIYPSPVIGAGVVDLEDRIESWWDGRGRPFRRFNGSFEIGSFERADKIVCGDGVREGPGEWGDINWPEGCDDGNTTDGDGCSSECVPEPGFTCEGDLPTVCTDIDECAAFPGPCDEHAYCMNLPASYDCDCLPGWIGDGWTCVDVDECQNGDAVCDPHASCTNTQGSYDCDCNDGWTGGGATCADIDECQGDGSPCDGNATCTNLEGSYDCACDEGFRGDGFVCVACPGYPDVCTGHGTCEGNGSGTWCICQSPWAGEACDDCEPGLYGATCEAVCPGGQESPCHNRGECSDGVEGDGTCLCLVGYAAPDCGSCDDGGWGYPECRPCGDCDDGLICTVDSCDPADGCRHVDSRCDDQDPCTVDACDTVQGCLHQSNPGCCRYDEQCQPPGECLHRPCDGEAHVCGDIVAVLECCEQDAQCDDGVELTVDRCDTSNGRCINTPRCQIEGCDDGNSCTTDTCLEDGSCSHEAIGLCCHDTKDCPEDMECVDDQCTLTGEPVPETAEPTDDVPQADPGGNDVPQVDVPQVDVPGSDVPATIDTAEAGGDAAAEDARPDSGRSFIGGGPAGGGCSATGPGGGAGAIPILVLAMGALAWARWRRRGLAVIAAVLVTGAAGAAGANPDVNSDTFRPSLHPGDILGIQTSAMPGHLGWSAGGWLTWNHKPLRFVAPGGAESVLIRDQVVLDVVGSLALANYLDIGLDVPVFLRSMGDAGPGGLTKVDNTALGDLRLSLKASFLGGRKGGFGLALAEDLTFPTSTGDAYNGDKGVTGTTTLIGDWAGKGFRVGLNAGFRLRKEVPFGTRPILHELLLGTGLQVPLLCNRLEAIGTAEVRTPFQRAFDSKYDVTVDLMAGLRYRAKHLVVLAAAGASVLEGVGSAMPRVTVQVAYAPEVGPGCRPEPVPDRDGDGIPDASDRCPDQPGPAATQGCPDRDGDGVIDREDACPDVAGKRELKGCPDRDGDGIADAEDACPDVAGKREYKGCPDRDGDTVIDPDDRCPDVKGEPALQGCPPPVVKAEEKRIEITDRIEFDLDQATLRPEALPILDAVAQLLKQHAEIRKVRIDGHTDNTAGAEYNLGLSSRRAKAVADYLVAHGIAAKRLDTKGFGLTKPIADNGTEEGRLKNRRVEFIILE